MTTILTPRDASVITLPRVERVFANSMALADFTDGDTVCDR